MHRKLLLALVLALLAAPNLFSSCTSPQNQVEAENCNAGTSSSQWQINGSGDSTIQGFATDISVNAGQIVNFKINTPATSYTIDIFRMGYYSGAGARKIITIQPSATLPQIQPACATDVATKLLDCGNWSVSASWSIPSTAVSGIYFALLTRSDTGGKSQIFFVIRNDASHSDLLFQTADETWQAYNPYGGHSLYGDSTFNLNDRAYKVSYNRPFNTESFQSLTWVFSTEYPMVRWLEANGYDVTYFASVDAARNGSLLTNHKVYLSVGHDEYWSAEKRASIETARSTGVNLAFFSGNEGFWKTRWENSIDGTNTPYRTLVCYKETIGPNSNPAGTAAADPLDPPTWTGTWRDATKSPPADGGRPENALDGTLFMVNGPGSDNSNLSIKVPAADGKMRFWRNTPIASQSAGQTWNLPAGTLGYEWDVDADNGFRPAGLFDLSTATYNLTTDYLLDYGGLYGAGTATHHLTLYRYYNNAGQPSQAPLGLIFGAGTVQWSWGLDANHDDSIGTVADVNMQQATVNLFADMGAQPATLQGGLLLASKSSDTQAPASTITSPGNGATISFNNSVTIVGTAVDSGGGAVAGVEISTDGGSTWHPATGRGSWSYSWVPTTYGSFSLLSRAVDDSGNLEVPSSGVTVTVPSPAVYTIWSAATVPGTVDAGPDSAVELGVKFVADVNGTIQGIRFYKSSANTGTHIGNLRSSTGTLLASATFTGETASGWQQVNFSSPVSITAGTVYVASYHTNVGHYSDNQNYFLTGVDNPPLHALQNGVSDFNGVFAYSGSSVFPNNGFNASNYWVDVAFIPSPNLNSITVTPANSSIPAKSAVQYTATASYSDGSQQNITAQVSWSSSNTNVATINSAGLASTIAGGSTTITATQGSVSGGATLTVQPTPLTISTTPLPSGVQAQAYSATLVASGGTAPYTWSLANNTTLPVGLTLSTAGQITGTPSVVGTSSFTVQLKDGGSPQQSATQALSITIAAAPTFYTIWSASTVPGLIDAGADSGVELGVKFKADVNGTINGIRFYKSSANTGTHVGNLWGSSGTLLASATFSGETASGWQQVNFSSPLSITAGTVYVASYHTNVGHYSDNLNYFASAGVDNAPLHALQNGGSGVNGVFAYGSNSVFPNNGYNSSNYWVDIAFVPAASLTSIAVTPANPSIKSGTTQQFKATGTYTDNSTQDITTQVTWSSGNTSVATINSAGLASGTAGGNATIIATQGSLSGSTTLTVQATALVINTLSLASGVQNQAYSATLSATGGTAPYTWSLANGTLPTGLVLSGAGQIAGTPTTVGTSSFTVQVKDGGSPQQSATQQLSITIAAPPSYYTIWSSTTVPGLVDAGPDSAVELGVKFKADLNGTITGIRFYKSSTNTGTHLGNLWSSTGTLLASATFTGETASGWQQMNFSNPVSITAGTVYVASYHTNVGHYSDNFNYFATAGVDNPPLHALQNGVSGFDGVFAYGSSSVFPNNGYNSSNYWVDIVFAP